MVLAPVNRKGVLVFIDDILVHSATLKQHCERLREVFQLLDEHQLKIKMSKCTFASPVCCTWGMKSVEMESALTIKT